MATVTQPLRSPQLAAVIERHGLAPASAFLPLVPAELAEAGFAPFYRCPAAVAAYGPRYGRRHSRRASVGCGCLFHVLEVAEYFDLGGLGTRVTFYGDDSATVNPPGAPGIIAITGGQAQTFRAVMERLAAATAPAYRVLPPERWAVPEPPVDELTAVVAYLTAQQEAGQSVAWSDRLGEAGTLAEIVARWPERTGEGGAP